MVCALNNNGANNIWEHALLENGGKLMKKKPNPKDPIRFKGFNIQCLCIKIYIFSVLNKNISKQSICNVPMLLEKTLKMVY